MIKILEILGKEVRFVDSVLKVETRKTKKYVAPYRLVRTMRASFCVLGPLLAKRKKAKVSLPGGCVIGPRPVDLHLKGLATLGADIHIEEGYCVAVAKVLKGGHIFLGGHFGSSVLATANIMMAATLTQGETFIEYSASEPEIVNLAAFLKAMGARIEGEGTHLIKITGVRELGGAEFRVIPDRIEAGTFIAASIATRSPLTIREIIPVHLTSVLEMARLMGATIKVCPSSLYIKPPRVINPVNITTLPYPGFPTDLQAQFMVPLSCARGTSLITEKIFPDRFMHIAELNRMGTRIHRNGPHAIIEGVSKLFGAEIMASDLRASAALVIAGLAAKGTTRVLRVYHIDRGYSKLEEKLRGVGAKIKREK
jgi:UDP-N-acetylglucosamine 1-carboxyvinyltransferase